MDLKRLALLVCKSQPLWDRNHEQFRDQSLKNVIWSNIGAELNTTDTACKEAYKALREKYIREREKLQQYGAYYKPWELLENLQFLDPYIITRKSGNTSEYPFEEHVLIKQDPSVDTDSVLQEDMDNCYNAMENSSSEFCRSLIKMVHDSKALWDRNYKDYSDKQMKDHLWKVIAVAIQSDATTCSLKWKSLREKYIRQKQKYLDGEPKWEFLDELSFLDSVILYRKKHWKPDESHNTYPTSENSALSQSNFDSEAADDGTNDSMPNQFSTSSQKQKQQTSFLSHTPDSTLEIVNKNQRKRSLSNASEISSPETKKILVNQERTPEEIFGELVGVMLAIKSDTEKKSAMLDIMSILTRPSR